MSEYEDYFRPTPECYECECGADLSQSNPPEPCDCEKSRCQECAHVCEWCNAEGCEHCMTDTIDGWTHKKQCAAALEASEDAKDVRKEVA